MSRARFIVTGATGFLGGELSRRLLRDGCEVVALGRNVAALEALARDGAQAVAWDFEDEPLGGISGDVLVHCAALSSPWGRRRDFMAANITGTAQAIALAKEAEVSRFVHVSTPSVYFRFADQVAVQEDAKLPPAVNDYAATKRVAEGLVLRETGLNPIVLRPRGIYGAGDTALLPRLLRTAKERALPLMRDGRAATDLTHVDDVVDAVLAAARVRDVRRRVFNVSGGVALNVREVIEQVGEQAGVAVKWRPMPVDVVLGAARVMEGAARIMPRRPEPMVTAYSVALLAYTQTLDISAARDELGWAPKVSFADGLARTFA